MLALFSQIDGSLFFETDPSSEDELRLSSSSCHSLESFLLDGWAKYSLDDQSEFSGLQVVLDQRFFTPPAIIWSRGSHQGVRGVRGVDLTPGGLFDISREVSLGRRPGQLIWLPTVRARVQLCRSPPAGCGLFFI